MRNLLVLIKIITLCSRLFFVLFLANKMTITDLGVYGAYSAAVFLMAYMVGLELGVISSRNINIDETYNTSKIISRMGLLIFAMSLFSLPAVWFMSNYVNNGNFGIVFCLILLEAFCTEYRKVLNSLQMPFTSSLVDFIKNAGWVWPIIFYYQFNLDNLKIEAILNAWTIGLINGAIVILYSLRKYIIFEKNLLNGSLNFTSNQVFIFYNGLSLLFIEVSARLILKIKGNSTDLGLYTLYSGFVLSIPILIWSATLAIDYRNILDALQKNKMMDFKIKVEKNFIRGFSYWVFLTILSVISILIYLNYFGKKEFYDNINSYFLMLLIPLVHLFVTNLSNVLHLTKKDNLIALAYTIGLIFCMPYYIYSINIHINEVILCTFLSYTIAAIVMYYYVWKNFKISLIPDFIRRF